MSHAKLRPAVFLDRDGTVNFEKNYLIDPSDFEFIPGVPAALKKLQDAGFLLVIVTNQSGVARGYFTEGQVAHLHQYMAGLLAAAGVGLAGIYICPHHPTSGNGDYRQECTCRKGQPGMLQQAARELDIDLKKSYMVGDKEADILAGGAAGCQSFLVRTGYGEKNIDRARNCGAQIVADLPEAARRILAAN